MLSDPVNPALADDAAPLSALRPHYATRVDALNAYAVYQRNRYAPSSVRGACAVCTSAAGTMAIE